MSIIKVPILFEGQKDSKILYALFDSGANMSCINSELAKSLGDPVSLLRPRKLSTASEGHYMEIQEAMILEFTINDVLLFDDFLLVPGLSEEVIIGADTFQRFKIKLDFENDTVIIDPKVAKLQVI